MIAGRLHHLKVPGKRTRLNEIAAGERQLNSDPHTHSPNPRAKNHTFFTKPSNSPQKTHTTLERQRTAWFLNPTLDEGRRVST
jgi:hypothetical protein